MIYDIMKGLFESKWSVAVSHTSRWRVGSTLAAVGNRCLVFGHDHHFTTVAHASNWIVSSCAVTTHSTSTACSLFHFNRFFSDTVTGAPTFKSDVLGTFSTVWFHHKIKDRSAAGRVRTVAHACRRWIRCTHSTHRTNTFFGNWRRSFILYHKIRPYDSLIMTH